MPSSKTNECKKTEDGTSAEMWGSNLDSNASSSRGEWLKDSRFAMFVHWGLYSELGGRWKGETWYGIGEWIMTRARIPVAEYKETADRFNPTEFNAREWVALAKDAGMRHIMITAKHMDGFSMFKSEASPYNIVDATPFGRDPMQELAEVCGEEGLRLGFYYSQTLDQYEPDADGNDWDWPAEGRDFQRYLRSKVVPQLSELLSGYGSIAGVWFDVPGAISRDESQMLVDLVHELQPQCLVNSRIGNGLGDYDTLGDQEIPTLPRSGLWESIDTHNDGWGYTWYDRNWKSARELAERLIRVVSRGGTYMLNVGPDGTGRVPEQSARILRELGNWVHAHESAIHGSEPTPFGPLAWGESTARGNSLFLFLFQWPEDGSLIVPGLNTKVKSAKLVGGDSVPLRSSDSSVIVKLPVTRPNTLIPVVQLDLEDVPSASQEQFVLNGYFQKLDIATADLKGCKKTKLYWMEKFGDWKNADCAIDWEGAGSAATWEFTTVEPGSFYLGLEYSCPAEEDYSGWQLTLNDQILTFPVIDTGERSNRPVFSSSGHGAPLPRFRTYHIGLFDLSKAGKHRLSIGPTGDAGNTVRIASVILTPAQ